MKTTLLAIAFLIAFRLVAQHDAQLTGVVLDDAQHPVDGAVLSLLNPSNKGLVKTAFTGEDGRFEFSGLPADSFQLLVSQPGFRQYTISTGPLEAGKETKLAPFILESEGKKLDEVTVVTKLPFVERRIDRTVINPDALISNAGGNAMDVLSKSPGIMVDENGNIKLKGKSGVMVYVDDKPTYMSGAELEAFLKSMPSASIKQIEIMNNPPAHYDAAGNSGIINIRTKRTRLGGFNGNVSAGYAQGRYPRSNDNLALNYNNKRISLFSNLSYGLHNGFHDLTIQRRYKNEDLSTRSVFDQNTYIRRSSQTLNARLGLDYYVSEKTTIGIAIRGLQSSSRSGSFNRAKFLDPAYAVTSQVIADNHDSSLFRNGTFNLNLRRRFDSLGRSISCDLDYVTYSTGTRQAYKNDVWLPGGVLTYSDTQQGRLASVINIYTFKSDYVHPLQHGSRLEGGVKGAYTRTDNDAVYTITQDDVTQNNYGLSNHFKYDELISSAYANYAMSFRRMELQAGLRFESTRLDGRQLGNAQKSPSQFTRMYNSLFPTLFWSCRLDTSGNHVLNLSYGRRINRPFYQDLNPFISPLDRYTYYEGNPYLRPTFANNASVAYSYKTLFTTTFSYINTINQIQETIEINNGIYYSRPGNIGSSVQYNLSLEGSIPVVKWLTLNFYTETQHARYRSQLYTEKLDSRGTYWYINVNNQFNFGKGWSAELSGEYITNFIDSQFSFGDFGHVTIGAQKKLFSDKGSLKVSLADVFYTNRIRGQINNLYLTDANWFGPRDTRVASLTFSYRFGKTQNSRPRHNSTGSEAEQGRVKS